MTVQKIASDLKDRIWFTRLARIYSEKRLLRDESHSQLLLLLYSVYSIALSVILMKFKPISDDAGSVFGLILSVTLFGLSLYLTTRGWASRAQQFKKNYTQLRALIDQLDLALCRNDEGALLAELELVQTKYQTLMEEGENHGTMDDRCARFLAGKTSRPLKCGEVATVFGYSIGRHAFLATLYLWPPGLMAWLWLAR